MGYFFRKQEANVLPFHVQSGEAGLEKESRKNQHAKPTTDGIELRREEKMRPPFSRFPPSEEQRGKIKLIPLS